MYLKYIIFLIPHFQKMTGGVRCVKKLGSFEQNQV